MNEKIIDRLRKLIRHEKSAKDIGSQAEAEAFAARIQLLLDEHNLSLSEIDIEEQTSTIELERTDINIRSHWRSCLLNVISLSNGVKCITSDGRAILVGSDTDRLIVAELFDYFAELGSAMATTAVNRYRREYGYVDRVYRNSFLKGYSRSLCSRIREAHESSLANAQQSTALIYIGNKLVAAEKLAEDILGGLRKARVAKSTVHAHAYRAGQSAGESVALTNKRFERTGQRLLT
jgi:hypothetical protein